MERQEHFLEVAATLAGNMGHTYIGTEHLLLAILQEENSKAATVVETAIIEKVGKGTPTELDTRYATTALKREMRKCDTIFDFIDNVCSNSNTSAGAILKEYRLTIIDLLNNSKDMTDKIEKHSLARFYENKNEEFPTLSQFARNLNLEYLKGNIADVFGRENEIETIKKIMLRRNKTNVLLLGKAGCGKTAIVEGLAIDIVNLKSKMETSLFSDFFIYDLNLNSLVSGSKYRGDFEEKVKNILDEIQNKKDVIIFIDEIHQINCIGNSGGDVASLGQILKPALSRNSIKCIGATTIDESKLIKEDKALARRFSEITVKEFSKEKQVEVAKSIFKDYSNFHNVNPIDVDVDEIIELIHKLMKNTVFPDNVINVIDETFANAKYDGKTTINMDDIKKTISRLTNYLII